jgi:hypothetical protein
MDHLTRIDLENILSFNNFFHDPRRHDKKLDDAMADFKAAFDVKNTDGLIPNAEEVIENAQNRSRDIFDSFTFLRDLSDRHKETIQKPWLKKSTKQRKKVLQLA